MTQFVQEIVALYLHFFISVFIARRDDAGRAQTEGDTGYGVDVSLAQGRPRQLTCHDFATGSPSVHYNPIKPSGEMLDLVQGPAVAVAQGGMRRLRDENYCS